MYNYDKNKVQKLIDMKTAESSVQLCRLCFRISAISVSFDLFLWNPIFAQGHSVFIHLNLL